jgi:hypothetical protein
VTILDLLGLMKEMNKILLRKFLRGRAFYPTLSIRAGYNTRLGWARDQS